MAIIQSTKDLKVYLEAGILHQSSKQYEIDLNKFKIPYNHPLFKAYFKLRELETEVTNELLKIIENSKKDTIPLLNDNNLHKSIGPADNLLKRIKPSSGELYHNSSLNLNAIIESYRYTFNMPSSIYAMLRRLREAEYEIIEQVLNYFASYSKKKKHLKKSLEKYIPYKRIFIENGLLFEDEKEFLTNPSVKELNNLLQILDPKTTVIRFVTDKSTGDVFIWASNQMHSQIKNKINRSYLINGVLDLKDGIYLLDYNAPLSEHNNVKKNLISKSPGIKHFLKMIGKLPILESESLSLSQQYTPYKSLFIESSSKYEFKNLDDIKQYAVLLWLMIWGNQV